jgi:protein O-mannosyl-transferase
MAKKQGKPNSPIQVKNEQGPINIQSTPLINETSILNKKDFVTSLLAMLFAILLFLPTTKYDYVNWDDDRNIFDNPLINSMNEENFWGNTKQIFKSDVIGNYNPLTIWSFAIENKIYNDNKNKKAIYNGFEKSGKYHRTNIILHGLCVALAFLIARRLGLAWFGSLIAALLFAAHPMRVESVAWVTERKDVLFGFFYLLSLYYYIKNKQKNSATNQLIIYGAFILSLFSKIQAVSLPLSMMAVDYLLQDQFDFKKSFLNKIPFLGLSILFGIMGIMFLGAEGSLDTNTNTYPFWQRIFVGSYSFLIYLVKLVVPYRLSPMYPYEGTMPSHFYPTIVMLPITLYALYKSYVNQWKWAFFALSFFIVNIIFLLQILGAGQGFIADRFTYIAYLGLFLGTGYLCDKYSANSTLKYGVYSVSILAILAYTFVTSKQITIWQNTATMWGHVIKYYDKTTLPYGNRANYYRDKKMFDLALADYNAAIKLNPEPQTHNSRARLYFDTAGNDIEKLKLALSDYNKAIELKPKDGEFWINRGATYARLGDMDKALENINQGLVYKPDHASGYLNRFVLLINKAEATLVGPARIELQKEALGAIQKYQSFKPLEANTWYETARLKLEVIDGNSALNDINRAIQLNNSEGLFHYQLAIIQSRLNNKPAARAALVDAQKLGFAKMDPAMVNFINN